MELNTKCILFTNSRNVQKSSNQLKIVIAKRNSSKQKQSPGGVL